MLAFKADMSFLVEAHSGISATIVERCNGNGIWASGVTASAAAGLRDANELSFSEVLNLLTTMDYCSSIPILVDGDTGYGNFNNARIFVKKLCSIGIAGVVYEDKVFPKINSFVNAKHELASIGEFCGKIKACKDAQTDNDFCLVARTEALIAKLGLQEAIDRASAYIESGADAIVLHSKQSSPGEIIDFCRAWNKTAPLVIIPTTYEASPVEDFLELGVVCMIFANQLMRASVKAMTETCCQLLRSKSCHNLPIAKVEDIFDIVNMQELEEAERKYLPNEP
jgi:phosphoenolpyruvate phosphomutase